MEPSTTERRTSLADWEPDINAETRPPKRQPAPEVEYFAGRAVTSEAAINMASDAVEQGMGA